MSRIALRILPRPETQLTALPATSPTEIGTESKYFNN